MRIIYLIILLCGSIYLISCQNNQDKKNDNSKPNYELEEKHYNDLRNKALNMTPKQIGITLPSDTTKIYGVVMDWNVGENTATLVTFLPGDASLYLSTGGGITGGASSENVKTSVQNFINKAEKYIDKAQETKDTPLPKKDSIKFYFLTNKGKFTSEESMKNFQNKSSEWFDLFEEANKVITELRMSH